MGILGKRRKRPDDLDDLDEASVAADDDAAARRLFQKAFEAKFKPLEPSANTTSIAVEEDDTDGSQSELDDGHLDEDDWSGLSQDEAAEIEVVQVRDPIADIFAAKPRDMRAFMSSKLQSDKAAPTVPSRSKKASKGEDDGDDMANLKNDLALQRLLKESHLLDATNFASAGVEPQGKQRLKAIDLRIQELGAKESILTQRNMPLPMQRELARKAVAREHKRRKDAAENGIILEKAKRVSQRRKPRDAGLDGAFGVGRFSGGMLKLSSKDVRSIGRSR